MSAEEALSELKRELEVRARCYDRWITEGRISRFDANDRYNRLHKAISIVEDRFAIEGVHTAAPSTPVDGKAPF